MSAYRSKPAWTARSIRDDFRCLLSHEEGAILGDKCYIDLVA